MRPRRLAVGGGFAHGGDVGGGHGLAPLVPALADEVDDAGDLLVVVGSLQREHQPFAVGHAGDGAGLAFQNDAGEGVHVAGAGEPRRLRKCRREQFVALLHALAVGAVTGGAKGLVDLFALPRGLAERGRVFPGVQIVHQRRDDRVGGRGERLRLIHPGGVVREDQLRAHMRVRVGGERGERLGGVRVLAHEQRLGELHRGAAHPRVGVLGGGEDGLLRQRPEPLQRPERMNARVGVGVTGGHRRQRRHRRFVGARDDQHLRGVAPPAVRMREMGHELHRRFIQHARLRAGLLALGQEAENAPVADNLDHPPLLDAMIAGDPGLVPTRGRKPLLFLNDAAVHVGKNKRAVGRSLGPHGPEIGVGAADEFALGKRVVRHTEAVFPVDRAHAQKAAHRFARHHASVKLRHQMTPQHRLPAAGRQIPEDALFVKMVAARGIVPHRAGGIRHAVARRVLGNPQDRIPGGKLEGVRRIRPARPRAKKPTVIIPRQAPLADAADMVLARRQLAVGVGKPKIIRANRVVEIPQHPRVLMLDVPAVLVALIDHLVPVRDAVLVVIEIGIHRIRLREIHQHPVVQREHRAREDDVVDEHRPLVHDPIAIRVHELHHAAHGIELLRGVLVLHVSAPLADIHRPVAIEGEARRLLDHRLARDALQPVALRDFHQLDLLRRSDRGKGRVGIPALLFLRAQGAGGGKNEGGTENGGRQARGSGCGGGRRCGDHVERWGWMLLRDKAGRLREIREAVENPRQLPKTWQQHPPSSCS